MEMEKEEFESAVAMVAAVVRKMAIHAIFKNESEVVEKLINLADELKTKSNDEQIFKFTNIVDNLDLLGVKFW